MPQSIRRFRDHHRPHSRQSSYSPSNASSGGKRRFLRRLDQKEDALTRYGRRSVASLSFMAPVGRTSSETTGIGSPELSGTTPFVAPSKLVDIGIEAWPSLRCSTFQPAPSTETGLRVVLDATASAVAVLVSAARRGSWHRWAPRRCSRTKSMPCSSREHAIVVTAIHPVEKRLCTHHGPRRVSEQDVYKFRHSIEGAVIHLSKSPRLLLKGPRVELAI